MFCDKVKEFLSQEGVDFTERNVATDEAAMADLQEIGYMTTPVTVVNGEVVVGFDTDRLKELLDG